MFRHFRKVVSNSLKKAKCDYYTGMILENKNKPKLIWKYLVLNKAVGLDRLPGKLIYAAAPAIFNSLTSILNLSCNLVNLFQNGRMENHFLSLAH